MKKEINQLESVVLEAALKYGEAYIGQHTNGRQDSINKMELHKKLLEAVRKLKEGT